MIYIAAISVLSLVASVLLSLAGLGSPVAVLHIALAVGVVPLIFAAISHFVPVLTRTGDRESTIRCLPWLAQLSGLFVVAVMNGQLPRWVLHPAVAVDLIVAIILLFWILRRVKVCLGNPHPGWRWYGMALVCLILALLVILLMSLLPEYYVVLKRVHLHLNTLGLIGLAALGTLPVLLPTAIGKFDPQAAIWLRPSKLCLVAGAIFCIALGSALGEAVRAIALAGGGILLLIVLGLLRQWLNQFGALAIFRQGAAASLYFATLGLCLVLCGGVAHALHRMEGQTTIAVWAVAFLLPLVTGALSQLLPVWRWPGPVTDSHGLMRRQLTASGFGRGLLFLLSGILISAGELTSATIALGLAIGLFVLAVIQSVSVLRSTR